MKAVVTGGCGFIGSYLTRKLVENGIDVVVVDSLVRGDLGRISDLSKKISYLNLDIRNEDALTSAFKGAEVVFHLAAVNGTENFYTQPELVLDVGIRGAIAVVNACRKASVKDLVVASTAEVYQTPVVIPTPETIELSLPNSLNPRYSYGGSKIATELITFNYTRDSFRKVQIFRPHNIYGPMMGWKHVVPQFICSMASVQKTEYPLPFKIQGSGAETRAFCYVDDVVDGILTMYKNGASREIYHIGNDDEISIRELALTISKLVGVNIELIYSPLMEGGTPRRCPDISKMKSLGYAPKISLEDGLRLTIDWYINNTKNITNNLLL